MATTKATVNVAPGATHYSRDEAYGQVKTISVPMRAPKGAQFFRVDNDCHVVTFYKYGNDNWYVFDTELAQWLITTRPPTEPLLAIP